MILAILVSFSLAASTGSSLEQQAPDWPQVQKLAREYSRVPSCDNAIALISALPDQPPPIRHRPDAETQTVLYEQVSLLEARMFHGDSCAVRLAFKLLNVSDAAFSEDLTAALGALVSTRPELFMRELPEARQGCELAGRFSVDYTVEEIDHETRLRIGRLREVSAPGLLEIRNRCIDVLEAEK